MRRAIVIALIAVLVITPVFVLEWCSGRQETKATAGLDMLQTLNLLQGRVNQEIGGLDRTVGETADDLAATGLSGEAADVLLADLAASDPSVVSGITIAPDGLVAAAMPASQSGLAGTDIGGQAIVREIFSTRAPVMSGLIPLAQGGSASVVMHPVFSDTGCLTGVVSAAFQPAVLIENAVEPIVADTPYTVMVVQPDGIVLYDADAGKIGKNTFEDAAYEDFSGLREIALSCSGNWSGHGGYSFYDTGFGRIVEKEAYWTTAGMHGTEWRLFIIRELPE